MPVVIGAKPQSHFSDPIGLLTDCHRRIERFLVVLLRVAREVGTGPLTGEEQSRRETALNYFRDAAPKHTADEEDSLFRCCAALTRRRRRRCSRAWKVCSAITPKPDAAHREVDRRGRAWLTAGSQSREESQRLIGLLSSLDALYRAHIALEEQELFPPQSA